MKKNKNNEIYKSSISVIEFKSFKSMKSEIIIQNSSKSSKQEYIESEISYINEKIFHNINHNNFSIEIFLQETQDLLFNSFKKL